MTDSADIDAELASRITTIEEALKRRCPAEVSASFQRTVLAVLSAPRSHLRSVVLSLVYESTTDAAPTTSRWLPVALAIKFLHVFSMSHSCPHITAEQRCQPAELTTDSTRILVGDLFLARAFELVLETDDAMATRQACLRRLTTACQRLCEGLSVRDGVAGARSQVASEAELLARAETQVGDVFAGAAEIGALLGGSDERTVAAFGTFGRELGIGYYFCAHSADYPTPCEIPGHPLSSENRRTPTDHSNARTHAIATSPKNRDRDRNCDSTKRDDATSQSDEVMEQRARQHLSAARNQLATLPTRSSILDALTQPERLERLSSSQSGI